MSEPLMRSSARLAIAIVLAFAILVGVALMLAFFAGAIDGGDRMKVKSFKVNVEPGAITVCVPEKAALSQAEVSEHAPREKIKEKVTV